MTQEAPWMGVTPDPPIGSMTPCTNSGDCSGELHYTSCPVNVRAVVRDMARAECSNNGHDWSITKMVGADEPYRAWCERCGKSLRMVESP